MESNFKNEDFEQFLKQSADGLRMRPSERVWKGISRSLSQRRRRFGYFFGISLLAITGLGYYLSEPSNAGKSSNNNIASNTSSLKTEQSGFRNHKTGTASVQDNLVRNQSSRPQTLAGTKNAAPDMEPTDYLASIFTQGSISPIQNENKLDVNEPSTEPVNDFVPTVVDSYPGTENTSELAGKKESKQETAYPLTIESVTNSYMPRVKTRKIRYQMFFTPTVSYRKLKENKTYTGSGFLGINDLNSAVNHKPDFGFQLGILAKYPISRKAKLRAGVQFNVNRYDIKTFNSSYELATIRFDNKQTYKQITGYNNFNGYKSDWLENFYLQVSAPLGVELNLGGNEKSSFGVASSIQPTYVIGDRAYLISTDYKNYLEVPDLVRPWNLNTSLEAFVNYSTGQIQWQVGPQVRYQLLSTYEKKYMVKEHLYDFGLKIGLSLNNQ